MINNACPTYSVVVLDDTLFSGVVVFLCDDLSIKVVLVGFLVCQDELALEGMSVTIGTTFGLKHTFGFGSGCNGVAAVAIIDTLTPVPMLRLGSSSVQACLY